MSVLPWPELEALFHEALARTPAERAAFLAECCTGRPDLQRQVEAMLRAHDEASGLDAPSSPTRTPLRTGVRLDAYEIAGQLGIGGMGEVYRARDTRLGREVAIKVLPAAFMADADRLARLEREARVLAALNHPNIATIYGIEESDGIRALVMELVEGDTLAERIGRSSGLPIAEALGIAKQIAEALEPAHEKGIVHRDLKPANVKITPTGTVKVLDFGLAKVTASDAAPSQAPTVTMGGTHAGLILGTAAYMSPEQARGEPVDKRTDIWAFGCVLFEMLTGRAPFARDTIADTLAAVVEREPEWSVVSPATPPSIVRLLRRCLEKDLRRRRHDIADARVEIDDTISGLDRAATVSSGSVPATLGRRRARLTWAIAGAAGLVLAGLAVTTTLSFRSAAAPERVPTRFEIPTPPTVDPASLALSLDGRQLAFVATTDGVRRLFVRPLDQVTARPLPGTDGALFPFWAPDGREVGFFAGGKLKRIDLTGGTPQVLADTWLGWGATWNRDGVIVFNAGPLLRVAASGGNPVPVTQNAPGDTGDVWPQFLPDGRRFLFFHLTNSVDTTGVYLGSLDGGEPTRVLTGSTMAVYAPPGVLLQVRQGMLVAFRFDATSGTVSGEPMPIAQNVGDGGFPPQRGGAFGASATGVLAYRVSGGERLRQLAWFDRAGVDRGAVGPPVSGFFIGNALSPDGQRIAVGRAVSGNMDVWLSDVESGIQSRFTFDPNDDGFQVWSPDGSRVVFASNRVGTGDLFEKSASGSTDEQPLLVTREEKAPLSWSRDGQFLLYRARDPKKVDFDLWALSMTDERKPFPVVQTPFDESSGEISPDGKWVAYTSNESSRMEVYVQSFPGPGGKRQLSSMGGAQLRWRPDGRELFYIAPDDRLMAVPIAVGADGQLEAGAPVPLFPTRISPYYDTYAQYSIAPDGRFLMNTVVEAPAVPPITVVLNWDAALKQ